MAAIENINYEAIKQIGSRPRSPINLWPFFSPSHSLPFSSLEATTHHIRSYHHRRRQTRGTDEGTEERTNGSKSFLLSGPPLRHEPHNNFRFPIKSLSCGALARSPLSLGPSGRRAETFSFRLVFPKQCGPINYSHARAPRRGGGVGVAGGR